MIREMIETARLVFSKPPAHDPVKEVADIDMGDEPPLLPSEFRERLLKFRERRDELFASSVSRKSPCC